jgi:methyl coenzyme M reductase subunit C-like uncharacterized protein (methanogenesis marker protein 7)
VNSESLQRIIDEMVMVEILKSPIPVQSALRGSAVKAAYDELKQRRELQPAIERAKSVVEKYGF